MKKKLTEKQEYVLRKKGTELPFTGKLLHNRKKGRYICADCGNVLFRSEEKFDSGTGWPSFDKVKSSEAVVLGNAEQGGHEVSCKKCGGHLGHLFGDGPLISTGKRYCINGVALKFSPEK